MWIDYLTIHICSGKPSYCLMLQSQYQQGMSLSTSVYPYKFGHWLHCFNFKILTPPACSRLSDSRWCENMSFADPTISYIRQIRFIREVSRTKNLKCDHSNETSSAVLWSGKIYFHHGRKRVFSWILNSLAEKLITRCHFFFYNRPTQTTFY